jgi:hypothetical protein
LTAAHCLPSDADDVTVSYGGDRSNPAQTALAAEIVRSSPDLNLALVRVASGLTVASPTSVFRRRIFPGGATSVVGDEAICFGWGIIDPEFGRPSRPSRATMSVISPLEHLVRLSAIGGRELTAGDAGGGCFTTAWGDPPFLFAVMVGVDGAGTGVAVDLTDAEVKSWIEGTMMARAPDVAVEAASTPAAAVTPSGVIDLFWVDGAGTMREALASNPASVTSLGSPPGDPLAADAPAAVYLSGDRHIVARSSSGAVYWQIQAGGGPPSDWIPLVSPGTIASGISLSSWQPDRMDIFAISGTANALHAAYSDGRWGGMEDLGTGFDLGITAVSFAADRLDAFGVAAHQVFHAWGSFNYWASLWTGEVIGAVYSPCAAVSWNFNSLDLFALNSEGRLAHKAYDGGWPVEWTDTGFEPPGPLVAVMASGQIHLFSRNEDGTLWHAYWPR